MSHGDDLTHGGGIIFLPVTLLYLPVCTNVLMMMVFAPAGPKFSFVDMHPGNLKTNTPKMVLTPLEEAD